MANLSDFLPAAAAGGGGGFTKMLKYSTARALDDADYNNAASYTVNPATDLGLEDGASIGYFMCGGGGMTNFTGAAGFGGKIIQGTAIITTASTNLILTPGVGTPLVTADGNAGYDNYATAAANQSTISGGLSITTADGANTSGSGSGASSTWNGSALPGINGYGAGGAGSGFYSNQAGYGYPQFGGNAFTAHGFGGGGSGGRTAALGGYDGSDGAIILFY